MTSGKFETAEIERIVSSRGNADERAEAIERLAEESSEWVVTRTLFQGLWDEDESVRDTCEMVLEDEFRAATSETKEEFLESLLTRLSSTTDPPQQAVTLLGRVVNWVRNNATDEPHLFGTVLSEAERARSGGRYPIVVGRKLRNIYRNPPRETSRSAELAETFDRKQAVETLRSDTATPRAIEDAITTLRDLNMGETDLEVLLYHLIPLYASYNYQVMNATLRNLEQWTAELPGSDLFELTDAVRTLKWYRQGSTTDLPGTLRNEIGFSEVGVDILADSIDEFRQSAEYERLVDRVLEVLHGVHGVREHVDRIEDVARQSEGDTRGQAIGLLDDRLVGLDAGSDHNDELIRQAYDETTKEADKRIRSLFEDLARDPSVADELVVEAVSHLVESRPPDIAEMVGSLLRDRPSDSPAVRGLLDAVAEETVLDAADPIVRHFRELEDEETLEAVETLEALGNEPAKDALEDALARDSDDISNEARGALARSGYYERVRAIETKDRAQSFQRQSTSVEEEREELAERCRNLEREYKRLEIEFRRQIFEADQILRQRMLDVVEHRIGSLDTLAHLQAEERQVESLVDRASSYHDRLGTYVNQLSLGTTPRNAIDEELGMIEQDLEYAESLVSGVGDRVETVQSRLDQLTEPELSPEDAETEREKRNSELAHDLWELEHEGLTDLLERYRSARDSRSDRLSSLREQFERERQMVTDASAAGEVLPGDIRQAIGEIQSRAQRIENLVATREQEWQSVQNVVQRRNSELRDVLDEAQSKLHELEELQQQIDELKREISELRLERHHLTQRVREEEEAYSHIEPRSEGIAEQVHEKAEDRAQFFKHRRIYAKFIRRYYEMELDEARKRRFGEQHGDTLKEVERELNSHVE